MPFVLAQALAGSLVVSWYGLADIGIMPKLTHPKEQHCVQTLRADQYSRDCAYLMQDPILRDMLKPEMQWQIAHGMAQTDEQVYKLLLCHLRWIGPQIGEL